MALLLLVLQIIAIIIEIVAVVMGVTTLAVAMFTMKWQEKLTVMGALLGWFVIGMWIAKLLI